MYTTSIISGADLADSDVVEDNIAAAMSSDLQGTAPPCSVPDRSEIGDRRISSHLDHGVVGMEFPQLRSGSGSVKVGFGKNRGATEIVLPSGDLRVGLAMGDRGMPVTSRAPN